MKSLISCLSTLDRNDDETIYNHISYPDPDYLRRVNDTSITY